MYIAINYCCKMGDLQCAYYGSKSLTNTNRTLVVSLMTVFHFNVILYVIKGTKLGLCLCFLFVH